MFPPESDWMPPGDLPPALSGVRRFGLDVETKDPELQDKGPGARRPGCHIVGISVSVPGWGKAYYPIRHEAPGARVANMDPSFVLDWLRDECASYTGEVVGANIGYDLDFLAQDNVVFSPDATFLDVQVAEPLLDEYRRTYKLEQLGIDYEGSGKDEALLRQAAEVYGIPASKVKANIWRLPPEYAGPYAEEDADLPLRIIQKQLERLEAEGLMPVFQMESELIPLLVEMRRRGVRVDLDRAEEVGRQMRQRRDDQLAEIKRLSGKALDIWSADSLGPALEERGFALARTGKTGNYSIRKEWLNANTHDELVAAVAAARRYDKVDNTFIKGHIFGHQIDGRIHCEFNQLRGDDKGTVAGRFSSTNPNLQQITARDEELAPLIRSLFVPDEGEVWEALDWSQIEYRFLAHFAAAMARAGKMTEAACRAALEAAALYCRDPQADFHATCADFAGMDGTDKYVRKLVKNVNFGKVYGAGPPKIAMTMGKSLEEAKEFIETYERNLPFVPEMYGETEKAAARRGYIRTISGRRARFPFWEPRNSEDGAPPLKWDAACERYLKRSGDDVTEREARRRLKRAFTYRALNRLLQGSAADLMKEAMRQIRRSGVASSIGPPLLTVHDELALSRPQTPEGEEAVREVKHIMETCMTLEVPIIADRESGPTWGDVK